MKELRCIVVDDEPNAADLIARYVDRVPFLHCDKVCYDAYEALEQVKNHIPDVIFLDINLPGLTGLDFAAMLLPSQKIIFTTAYSEHALESFSFFAVDYLLKPITFNRFMQAIAKVQALTGDQQPEEKKELYLKTGKQFEKINLEEVLYIEGMREYACVYTVSARKLIYKRMKELVELLPANFMRVHNSYIVNTRQVKAAAPNELLIRDRKIPVSASYKPVVAAWLQNNTI